MHFKSINIYNVYIKYDKIYKTNKNKEWIRKSNIWSIDTEYILAKLNLFNVNPTLDF